MFYPLFITNKTGHNSFKSGCAVRVAKHFKRRLVHSVELTIMAKNNFVPLLKSFIANLLNIKPI